MEGQQRADAGWRGKGGLRAGDKAPKHRSAVARDAAPPGGPTGAGARGAAGAAAGAIAGDVSVGDVEQRRWRTAGCSPEEAQPSRTARRIRLQVAVTSMTTYWHACGACA